ncbi:MAG TPA: protein-disulfide reductase DsbD domain-containing protein [Blastocatellia bacterium]
MKASRLLFLSILLSCFSATAMGQSSASVIKVRPAESSYKIKQGSAAQVGIVVEIDNGYHINSNRPSDKNLIATALKFDRMAGLTTGAVIYPKAKMQKFEFSAKPLSVFEDKVTFKLTARALPTLAPGNHTLKGKLTVQACNNEVCLRPQTVDVAIPVEVASK